MINFVQVWQVGQFLPKAKIVLIKSKFWCWIMPVNVVSFPLKLFSMHVNQKNWSNKISFKKWSEMARKLAKSLFLLLYLIFDSLQCCKVLFFLAVSPPKDQHTPSVAVIETLYSHWHLMGTDTQLSINKYLQTKLEDASEWTSATFAFSLHPICLLSLIVSTNSEICL